MGAGSKKTHKGTAAAFTKTLVQRLFITVQLFNRNGLANHAAAGAYGFLLSGLPVILLIALFMFTAFRSSPESILGFIAGTGILTDNFDKEALLNAFLLISRPGISGLISVISIIWAARIFVLSLQRGLKVIFAGPKKRIMVTDWAVIAGVEFMVIFIVLVLVLSSRLASRFFETFGFFTKSIALLHIMPSFATDLLPIAALSLITFCTYLIIPVNAPRLVSAVQGAVVCIVPFCVVTLAMQFIMNRARFSFLYGAMGGLVILLVNVYFFFIFYFFGAQLAFVTDSFEALLFTHLRKTGTGKPGAKKKIEQRLLFTGRGKLQKYMHTFAKGELIFSKGDDGKEVYYIVSGEVEVFLHGESGERIGVISEGSFFGEMEYLLDEKRTATIKARSETTVMILPPALFDGILRSDPDTGRAIIEILSRRLKYTDEKFITS
jgi:membrane protein